MKPRYSKGTVDEAVQLLDVYASQAAWDVSTRLVLLRFDLGVTASSHGLAVLARQAVRKHGAGMVYRSAEAAQRLREGWRP
jgi:hypothetical protein